MTVAAVEKSSTPILDLLRPLPMPDQERATGRFALPFLTFVAMIVITGDHYFLALPFGFLAINCLTILIHEFGHLVAGWCVGLRFKGIHADPFRLRIDSGRWKFRIRPRLFRGFALMSLDKVCRVRRRLIVFVAGGSLASIGCGIAAIVAGEKGLAGHVSSGRPAFLDCLGVWSLFIGCLALFRSREGYVSDGVILRALLFSKIEGTQLVASYALSTIRDDWLLPPDYVRRWFRLASLPTRMQTGKYFADWLAYESEGDPTVAAQWLEHCLAGSAQMDQDKRDNLIAEAVFFLAYRRRDPAKAEIWLKRLVFPERLNALTKIRSEVALSCSHEQMDHALKGIDRGLELIRQSDDSAERRRFESSWTSWRQEISDRVPVTVS